MKERILRKRLAIVSVLVALIVAMPVSGQQAETTSESIEPTGDDSESEVASNLDASVQEEVDAEIAEKRRNLLQEAVTAVAETKAALAALDEDRPDDALEALAVVTGKLDLIVARDPELALAPMGLDITTHDVVADVEEIEAMIEDAERLLRHGRIQEARALLAPLGSEIIVSVTNIPLATYPDAIKDVVPLIDAGKTDEAAAALQLALNTLVVTEHVIPLPIVRAQILLEEANGILADEDRTVRDTARLPKLVDVAESQFQIAEALGYGDEDDFEELRSEWNRVAAHVSGESPDADLLAKVQTMLAGIRDKVFAD